MRRNIDLANVSINITQLVAVVGLAWTVATAYQHIIDRAERVDGRLVDMQSQMGEANARLSKLETAVGIRN